MRSIHTSSSLLAVFILQALTASISAQKLPYDVYPEADPPYYRVRYDASTLPGELVFPVKYTIWIPPGVRTLRGVVVHQHGCGEGSCKSGLTGAFDLHWQALARKHDCALMAPSYEQPQEEDCQLWCDPRNGSDITFHQSLNDLGTASGHPELATVPWALWGHSGGGTWVGSMTLLYPDRVVAVWMRSGIPRLVSSPTRPTAKTIAIPEGAYDVPMMCNPGTKEGVTVKEGRFAGVWPAMEQFFRTIRTGGGLIGVAVDPFTGHECGNQRYLAIPWLDACLDARLPEIPDEPLRSMPEDDAWYALINGTEASSASQFTGEKTQAIWLPNESIAKAWQHYINDTEIPDSTPPPVPIILQSAGGYLKWDAEADLESGLANFIIDRDGMEIATVPEESGNPFGRQVFQGLQYSDTPLQPLRKMNYTDTLAIPGRTHTYRVIAVNTAGLRSK